MPTCIILLLLYIYIYIYIYICNDSNGGIMVLVIMAGI